MTEYRVTFTCKRVQVAIVVDNARGRLDAIHKAWQRASDAPMGNLVSDAELTRVDVVETPVPFRTWYYNESPMKAWCQE